MVGTLEFHFGVGAVARTDGHTVGYGNGCLDFKLVGTVVLHALGRDVFQYGIELHVLQGTQGDFHENPFTDVSHFGFVYVTTENQVAHVGYGSEYQSVDGRADERATERGTVLGDTFLYNLQVILCRLNLLACLTGSQQGLFVFFVAHQLVVVELLHTCQVGFRLPSVHFRQPDTTLGRVQLSQFGDDLYLGYHFPLLHFLSRLLVYFGDDTRNLGLDFHFVARFNLSRSNGSLYQVGRFYFLDVVLGLFRL